MCDRFEGHCRLGLLYAGMFCLVVLTAHNRKRAQENVHNSESPIGTAPNMLSFTYRAYADDAGHKSGIYFSIY